MPSSLDILEHFFDHEPRRLFEATGDDIAELRRLLVEYFDTWLPPDLSEGETRLHLDLRAFRGFIPGHVPAVAVSYERPDLDSFIDESDARIVRMLRRECSGPLLYADRVVDLDPLAFWSHDREAVPDRVISTYVLGDAWEAMRRVEPLLNCGALILAPIPGDEEMGVMDEQLASLEQSSFDLNAMYDWLAFLTAQRTLATVPTMRWSAVEPLVTSLGDERAGARDQTVVEALRVVDLPILTDIPVQTFAEIRETEPAFKAWRSELRMMSRLLPRAPDDPEEFRREAQSLFDDVLTPRIEDIRRAVSRSSALRTAAKEQPLRTTLGALAAGGVAAATGGSVGIALASTGVAGLAQVLSAAALPRKVDGSGAVIVKLLEAHRRKAQH